MVSGGHAGGSAEDSETENIPGLVQGTMGRGDLRMWILPKQLLTSPSAPVTEELISDSNEFCQRCEQSLMWRSKPSPARTWLQRWKRTNWIRHLSGRTLKRVSGRSFVTGWICSVAAIRANPSRQQETAKATKTQDTSGLSFKGQLGLFDQDTASLRMSKDILPSALKTSATTWESWVTSLRQDYSVRLKSAHLTREKEFSSWPTVAASEARQGYQNRNNGKRGSQNSLTTVVIETGPPAPENPSTSGKSQELWATPTQDGNHNRKGISKKAGDGIATQVQNWPTPAATETDAVGPRPSRIKTNRKTEYLSRTVNTKTAKLNPSWVEQLMGLPVGWTQLPTAWID